MENWIGIGIWIVMGGFVGLVMKALIRHPDERPGHTPILFLLGVFGAVVGGMLGVGVFEFPEPAALSAGGFGGALLFSILFAGIYRWGLRGLL